MKGVSCARQMMRFVPLMLSDGNIALEGKGCYAIEAAGMVPVWNQIVTQLTQAWLRIFLFDSAALMCFLATYRTEAVKAFP